MIINNPRGFKMHPQLSDTEHKEIINKALDAAISGMESHDKILNSVLPETSASKYSEQTGYVISMINNVKSKVNEDRNLNPADASIVNKALIEYIQKTESAQTHMFHMVRDLNELAPFKEYVQKIHISHMQFNQELAMEEAAKISLKASRQNNSPRP